MPQDAVVYSTVLVMLVAGTAAMLAAEFFHGVHYLLYVGGALDLLAIGGLTAAISRAGSPAEHAE